MGTPDVWSDVAGMRRALATRGARTAPLVLVPTMGDLHEGHLSLVRVGAELGDVVVSIFVNPTQFAPGEDYDRYPRRLQADLERLAPFGVRGVLAPSVEEMYPPGESTRVEVRGLQDPLCGRHREGHFLGVTTVCTKLFAGVRPDLAVFGQKDAQQCLLLHRLVRDLLFDVDLVFAPTVREGDGLAMSSRNRYLEGEERSVAAGLSSSLQSGLETLRTGERDTAAVESVLLARLQSGGVDVDYAEVRTVPDLEHPARVEGRVLLAVAGRVGAARLIDNLCLEVDASEVREAPLVDACTPEAARARWAARD